MASFIDFAFEPPIIYFLMVAGTIFGVWWILKRYGLMPTGHKTFEGETLTQIIQDQNLIRMMQTFGLKIKKGKLVLHLKTIKINRVASIPVKIEIRSEQSFGRFKKKKYVFKECKQKFLVFKSGGGLFESIPGLKYLHKTPEFFVINDEPEFITKDLGKTEGFLFKEISNIWTINPNTFPHTFGGVWVFSTEGVAFLTELAYKKMQENDKEESVNALKRFIFYNDNHTARIVSMERKQELKDDSWDKAKKEIN